MHDASGLEKSPPCLLVLDSDRAIFLYQVRRVLGSVSESGSFYPGVEERCMGALGLNPAPVPDST